MPILTPNKSYSFLVRGVTRRQEVEVTLGGTKINAVVSRLWNGIDVTVPASYITDDNLPADLEVTVDDKVVFNKSLSLKGTTSGSGSSGGLRLVKTEQLNPTLVPHVYYQSKANSATEWDGLGFGEGGTPVMFEKVEYGYFKFTGPSGYYRFIGQLTIITDLIDASSERFYYSVDVNNSTILTTATPKADLTSEIPGGFLVNPLMTGDIVGVTANFDGPFPTEPGAIGVFFILVPIMLQD